MASDMTFSPRTQATTRLLFPTPVGYFVIPSASRSSSTRSSRSCQLDMGRLCSVDTPTVVYEHPIGSLCSKMRDEIISSHRVWQVIESLILKSRYSHDALTLLAHTLGCFKHAQLDHQLGHNSTPTESQFDQSWG